MLKLNNKIIKPTIFPDLTSQLWKLDEVFDYVNVNHVIEWRFENEGELFHLKQLVDLVRSYSTRYKLHLWMPYLPYGRQDKKIHNNECFALRSFADVINTMKFEAVASFDPHSNLPERIINNFKSIKPGQTIHDLSRDYDTVCYPDNGAHNRYMVIDRQFLIGDKVRDQSTGRITSYSLNREPEQDEKVLVVDDLCDGGATFNILGEALQKSNAQASLYVSHGIFSKGLEQLKIAYNKIITTDTLNQKEDNRLSVLHVANPFTGQ